MSDVSPPSGVSGLSFNSTLLSSLLFFCLIPLLFLSCHFSFFFSAYQPILLTFFQEVFQYFSLRGRLFGTAIVQQLWEELVGRRYVPHASIRRWYLPFCVFVFLFIIIIVSAVTSNWVRSEAPDFPSQNMEILFKRVFVLIRHRLYICLCSHVRNVIFG